jgi:hypothetical protein
MLGPKRGLRVGPVDLRERLTSDTDALVDRSLAVSAKRHEDTGKV